MDSLPIEQAKKWSGEAFRNIATCDPTQDLYDDIVDPEDFELLFEIEGRTQGIDKSQPGKNRCFQYGNIDRSTLCFERFFSWGRFGAGNYGVWYGALEEETSIAETSYKRPEIDKNDFENSEGPIVQCRRMFKASLDAKLSIDTRTIAKIQSHLTSDDYSFCQNLGEQAIENNIDMFLTPSARRTGGICTPVFSGETAVSDQAIRSYLVIYESIDIPARFAPISEQK